MPAQVPVIGAPGSFSIGAQVVEAFADAGIMITGHRWVYGSAQRDSFPEHLGLAGQFIESVPTGSGFKGASGWYPGDHKGCLCSTMSVLRGPDGRFVSP